MPLLFTRNISEQFYYSYLSHGDCFSTKSGGERQLRGCHHQHKWVSTKVPEEKFNSRLRRLLSASDRHHSVLFYAQGRRIWCSHCQAKICWRMNNFMFIMWCKQVPLGVSFEIVLHYSNLHILTKLLLSNGHFQCDTISFKFPSVLGTKRLSVIACIKGGLSHRMQRKAHVLVPFPPSTWCVWRELVLEWHRKSRLHIYQYICTNTQHISMISMRSWNCWRIGNSDASAVLEIKKGQTWFAKVLGVALKETDIIVDRPNYVHNILINWHLHLYCPYPTHWTALAADCRSRCSTYRQSVLCFDLSFRSVSPLYLITS